jgi:transposase InsO family protein
MSTNDQVDHQGANQERQQAAEGPGGGTPTRAGAPPTDAPPAEEPRVPGLYGRRAGTSPKKKPTDESPQGRVLAPRERLHMLDLWARSALSASEFGALVGVSKQTLVAWRKRFDELGPAGLEDRPRGVPSGSKLDELTKRTILMLKQSHPEYGCERISHLLLRGPALAASPGAIARVLKEAGYETEEVETEPHEPPVRRFERAKPNQLWQTDLFTFLLKRQGARVYLVAFMDDHSRFVTGFGLHASQSTALTLEVLRVAIAAYGSPEEVLTDNGAQYVTWRGKSAFTKELEKRGIRQIVARPRRPQTLGKVERFWGTLWRECLETAVFRDLADARARIGQFIDYYNFQRPHQGMDGLVPADRFFGVESEVRKALAERVAANALDLARNGPKPRPFYLAGQVNGEPFSVHAAGEQLILMRGDGQREEVALVPPESPRAEEPTEPVPPPVCPDGSPTASEAGGETDDAADAAEEDRS